MQNIYRIRSSVLRAQQQKFETVNARAAHVRLAEIKATIDPQARLLTIPANK